MEIRYITSEDDRMEISKIYEKSWKNAYNGIIPQLYLDSIPKGRWAPLIDAPDRYTLIVVEDKKFVGVCSFGKSRFQQFDNWGEIFSIYLLPEYMGRGFGKSLLNKAVAELKKQGYLNVFLWVFEENIIARRFYEKFGFFAAADILHDKIAEKDIPELRYIYKIR